MENNKLSVPVNVSISDSFIKDVDKKDLPYLVVFTILLIAISFIVNCIFQKSLVPWIVFAIGETVLYFMFRKIENMVPIRFAMCFIKGLTIQQVFIHKKIIKEGEIIVINEQPNNCG